MSESTLRMLTRYVSCSETLTRHDEGEIVGFRFVAGGEGAMTRSEERASRALP